MTRDDEIVALARKIFVSWNAAPDASYWSMEEALKKAEEQVAIIDSWLSSHKPASVPSVQREWWVNVYRSAIGGEYIGEIFNTRTLAKKHAGSSSIRCAHLVEIRENETIVNRAKLRAVIEGLRNGTTGASFRETALVSVAKALTAAAEIEKGIGQ